MKTDPWRIHARALHSEGHSLESFGISPVASHPISPPDRNYLVFAPKGIILTIPYFQGFQTPLPAQPTPLGKSLGRSNQRDSKTSRACYDHHRCNLNLVPLFLCHFLGALSSSLTHVALNLQPPLRTVLYQSPGSSAAVLQSPVMSNTRRSSATQCVHYFSFPLGPHFPAFFSSV